MINVHYNFLAAAELIIEFLVQLMDLNKFPTFYNYSFFCSLQPIALFSTFMVL